jgi:quinol monooxygenase YgiN
MHICNNQTKSKGEVMHMYGTVAQMRVKAGHQDDLIKLIGEWNAERAPKISGAVSGYMVRLDSDPQDMMMIGIFESKESFQANANDPVQDQWFQRIMEHLESETKWHDGEFSKS